MAALLSLGACGDDGGSPDVDGGVPEDSAGADAGGLTVDVSPSDGQKGVLKTTPLVLTFIKPMNTASIEAAWTSASLPKAQMQFSWNTAGTILSVDASAVLEYPVGGLDVDLMGYTIHLDAGASAQDGEALASAVDVSFDTARDITVQIPATTTVGEGTGSFDGTASTVVLRVGDTPSNATWRTFTTFPLTSLPVAADVVQWTSASLFVRQASLAGTPYGDLGNVTAGRVATFTAIDAVAFAAVRTNEVPLSSSTAVGNPGGDRSADVRAAVEAAHGAASSATTFRLDFDTAQDLGGDEDVAIFESPRLDLRFLAK